MHTSQLRVRAEASRMIVTRQYVVTCEKCRDRLDVMHGNRLRPEALPGGAGARSDRREVVAPDPARFVPQGTAALPGVRARAAWRSAQHAFHSPQDAGGSGGDRDPAL